MKDAIVTWTTVQGTNPVGIGLNDYSAGGLLHHFRANPLHAEEGYCKPTHAGAMTIPMHRPLKVVSRLWEWEDGND